MIGLFQGSIQAGNVRTREMFLATSLKCQALVGLQGVLKVSHAIVHGISVLNLDGFAPLSRWPELSPEAATGSDPPGSEVA
jgi:hypothetical protein